MWINSLWSRDIIWQQRSESTLAQIMALMLPDGSKPWTLAGIILCMHPSNGRWHDNVTSSVIDWVHIQNDPCLSECWLIISEVLRRSPEVNFIGNAQDMSLKTINLRLQLHLPGSNELTQRSLSLKSAVFHTFSNVFNEWQCLNFGKYFIEICCPWVSN